jgi:hypothetical protein
VKKLKFWHSVSIVLIPLLAMVLGLNLLWPFSHNISVVEAAGPAYSGGAGNSLIQSLTAAFSADHAVIASITPSAAQTAGCSISGTGTVSANATVNLQAHTVSGWTFSNWSSADITISNPAANPLTFTMPDKQVAVTATFSVVPLPATTTIVTSSVNPSTSGQAVTFTATVTAAGGLVPTGTVTFKDGAADIGAGTLSSGSATFATTALAVGNHSITAVYGGNSNFSGSTSSIYTQTVNAIPTYAVTAGITPSGAQAAGCNITGAGNYAANATVNLQANIVSGWTFINWSSSDITISNATANPLTFTMPNKTITVTATFSPISYAVTAGITPSAAQTAGCNVTGTGPVSANTTVSLQANIVSGWTFINWSSSDITITNATANPLTFTMPSKAVAVTATFSQVPLPATTTIVTSNVNPSTFGQAATFTATVTAAGGLVPTGTVTFKDGAADIGTGTLSSGSATFATTALAVGNHSITAVYGGNSSFSGSTSSIYTQTVNGGVVVNPGPGGGGGGSSAPTSITGVGSINVGSIVNAVGTFSQSATVTSSEGLATVSIPRGTTGTVNGLSLSTITVTQQTAPPSPSAKFKLLGTAYDFGPNGATFNPPISLAFGYNPANIPAGIAENSLGVAFYDSAAGQWVALPGSVVYDEGYTITVQVSHFTYFAVVAVLPTSSVPVSTPTPGSAASATPTPTAAATPSVTSQPTPSSLAPTLTGTPVPSVTTPMASSTPKPVTTTASPLTSSAATSSPTPPVNISLYIIISIFIGVATIVVISLMVIRRRRL